MYSLSRSSATLSPVVLAVFVCFCLFAPSASSVVKLPNTKVRQHSDDDILHGFATKINTGNGVFRPIMPGTRVPAANEMRQATSPAASNTPSPSMSTTPTPSVSPSEVTSAIEPSVEPSPSDDVCFPGSASVELEDGSSKTMDKLQIGDVVRVSENDYSPVFMFTHRLTRGIFRFVQLFTASGHQITLTPSHYLYLISDNKKMLAAAGTAREGDSLLLNNGQMSQITRVNSNVLLEGLYNPQTMHGDVVVDGIVASTYTKSVDVTTAHALLTPLRTLYDRFGLSLTCFSSGAGRLSTFVPSGSDVNIDL